MWSFLHLPVPRIHGARYLGRMLFLSVLVGAIAGLGAVGFHWLLSLAKHLFLDGLAGYRPAGPGGEGEIFAATAVPLSRWILFLLPVAGGLVGGILVYALAPEAEGHGTDGVIDAYHRKGGIIRARVPLIKTIASAITIGTGGSAGREGPIAQIGAGFGSILGGLLGLSTQERRILVAAGMGAGIGAIFHAPLAGALFSAEVLYREMDLEHEVIVPSVFASITGYSIFALFFGWKQLFTTPDFVFHNPLELLPYFVLAVVLAAGAWLYIRVFYWTRDIFGRLTMPNHLKPALGGLMVGAIGLILPEALASGYGVVQGAFLGGYGAFFLLVVALAKMLTTSFTIGSGGSGGVFGPAVVIGGALGGAVGLVFQEIAPSMSATPGAFVMVGMAGFFAAAANTPLSTIIMVSELTGNYNLLVPSMWVCIIAFLLVRKHTLYEKQVPRRADSTAHRGEMMRDILRRLTVGRALDVRGPRPLITLAESTSLREIWDKFAHTNGDAFPVVNREGRLCGTASLRVLRQVVLETGLDNLVVARDVVAPTPTLTLAESLESAMRKMNTSNSDELAVVDHRERDRILTTLNRSDMLACYEHELDMAEVESLRPHRAPGLSRALSRLWLLLGRRRSAEGEFLKSHKVLSRAIRVLRNSNGEGPDFQGIIEEARALSQEVTALAVKGISRRPVRDVVSLLEEHLKEGGQRGFRDLASLLMERLGLERVQAHRILHLLEEDGLEVARRWRGGEAEVGCQEAKGWDDVCDVRLWEDSEVAGEFHAISGQVSSLAKRVLLGEEAQDFQGLVERMEGLRERLREAPAPGAVESQR